MTTQAITQIRQAAQKGDAFALTELAILLLETCENRQEQFDQGVELLQHLAEYKNVIWAKNLLTGLYVQQSPIDISHKALITTDAINQMKKYVQLKNVWAATSLGVLSYLGETVPRIEEDAKVLLSWASSKGCLWAEEFINEHRINKITNLIKLEIGIKEASHYEYRSKF